MEQHGRCHEKTSIWSRRFRYASLVSSWIKDYVYKSHPSWSIWWKKHLSCTYPTKWVCFWQKKPKALMYGGPTKHQLSVCKILRIWGVFTLLSLNDRNNCDSNCERWKPTPRGRRIRRRWGRIASAPFRWGKFLVWDLFLAGCFLKEYPPEV